MDLLLCNLPWENNQICLDSSLTSALVQFNFNKLNKIDYDDDLNSRQVPKMHVLLRRLTSNYDVLYSGAFQVLMKIYSQENDASTGEKLAIDSTRFSGKALPRSLLSNETQTLAPLTPTGLPTALCSSVPDVNMFDDLLAKKVLSMELNVRQRRVVRTADLRRINKHTLEELEGEISDGIFDEPSPKKAKTNHPPDQGEQDAPAARPESVRSLSYEPTEPIDDLPKDPTEDPPLPVADPSSGLDLPTLPGLDLPDESRRLDLDLRDSVEPQSPQQAEAAAAPPSGEAGAGLMPEPLPQDVPIPDGDDSEADQPTIAADNTITQSSMPEAHPQLSGLSFAERRRQHERSETSWMRSPLWPLVHDHPDPQSPGKSKRAKHHESVNITVELFPNGCEGSTNLPAGWHYDPKTHEIYLGSTADFWSFEDGFLVRNHVWSRDCTFHTTDFPLPAEKLQTTNGLTMRRNSRIMVNEEQSAPVGDEPWFGKTLYPLTKDAAAEFGQNYVGDLSKKFNNKTIRSRGHIWSAQAAPKKKNVNQGFS